MKKENLIKAVSESTKISPDIVSRVVESTMSQILNSLYDGDQVIIRKFGTFKLIRRKAREGQDFHSGNRIVYPEHFKPKFEFSREFVRKIREKV